jgi:hypothetical protein
MSNSTALPGTAGHHAVHFYSDESRLCLSVADFLADGLAASQPVVVIATAEHRKLIVAQLALRRFDVEALQKSGDLVMLDARKTLSRFFADGRLDAGRFRSVVGEAIDKVCAGRPAGCVVRAYGEMVDVLWRDGKCQEAIELEIMWNDLARTHAFSLLCGYAMGSFYKETGRDEVCALHTHIHQ